MNCEDGGEMHKHNPVIRRTVPARPLDLRIVRPATAGAERSTFHATATPRPTLMFAIASDDVGQVRRVLESGEVKPSDQIGPQSALAFALTNDRLRHKIDIVKTLLAYGADPASLKNPDANPPQYQQNDTGVTSPSPFDALLEGLDPATR
jgi:hypothetical protein